jgi:hypothetical protein
MSNVVAEYAFDPPLDDAARSASDRRLGDCLEVREIRALSDFLSLDRRRRVRVFEAKDADAVRYAHRSANVPFVAIWSAV